MSVYAVIHAGGKQYRVSPGDVVRVEKLAAQSGETMELDQVYLLAHEGRVIVGNPVLKNCRVMAQVLDQDRGEKIIVFKHKRRKGYRKTMGHRQCFTELKIIEIVHEGAAYREQPEKPKESQKPAAVAAAPAVKKAVAAKPQAAAKKKPGKLVSASKPEKQSIETALPRQPEKPKPVVQPAPQELEKPLPAPQPAPQERELPIPAAQPVPRKQEDPLPAAQPAAEAQPAPIEQEEKPSSSKRRIPWVVAAIIGALVLLVLVMFIKSKAPSPGTGSRPTQETQRKTPPPHREIEPKKTTPVNKPAAPAQPPD